MFEQYPKARPKLPEAYQKIYDEYYRKNREGATQVTSISSKLERWLHKKVAEDVQHEAKTTLEIGAGTLNQLDFEPYISIYDIIEPYEKLYKASKQKDLIRDIYRDIADVPKGHKYQRITSIAAFEHILSLSEVVARTTFLLAENGCLRVSIPNEGSILWRLGTMVTGYEFKKQYRLDYQVLMRHEHVNTAKEIEELLKYFYQKVQCSCFGVGKRLAFYRFYHCEQPNVDLARAMLNK